MEGFEAKFEGLAEIEQKLKGLATKDAQRIVRAGCMAGGRVLQEAITERAPERPDLPSGDALPPGALARDIVVHFGRDLQGLPAAIVAPGKYTRHVAMWVEYGHRMIKGGYNRLVRNGLGRGPGRRIKLDTATGDVPAHPFIRPGYEASRGTAVTAAIAAVRKELARVTAGK
ncbi:MAG TPA: hypothetical protein VKB47_08810 [Terracidiphilus sp.]|nr:hypothetical protein [Terracidiphilus sp.]